MNNYSQAFVTFDSQEDLLAKYPNAVMLHLVKFSNGLHGKMWKIGEGELLEEYQIATCPDSDDPRWEIE